MTVALSAWWLLVPAILSGWIASGCVKFTIQSEGDYDLSDRILTAFVGTSVFVTVLMLFGLLLFVVLPYWGLDLEFG